MFLFLRVENGGAHNWVACVAMLALSLCLGLETLAQPVPGGGFSFPADCRLGKSCWIFNYPDATPGPERGDFRCNHLTYDAHKGTDIGVRDLAAMRHGVGVMSVADGTVLRTRDSINDDGRAPNGRDCGNGVVVSHGGGWETQYCHLRRGSIAVRPGDIVRRGMPLGMVGMSGRAEFPHVHFEIRHAGRPIDPFTGLRTGSGCGRAERALWRDDARPAYEAVQIYAAGFATGKVDLAAIQRDASSPMTFADEAPAIVLWVTMLGVRPGDRLSMRITSPDGTALFTNQTEIRRAQLRRLVFGGRRLRQSRWPPGTYIGEASLTRKSPDGSIEKSIRTKIDVR